MPEFRSPKKRPARNSVDGIITRQTKRIGTPEYYNNKTRISNAPRKPLASRSQDSNVVIESDDLPMSHEKKIGDFKQAESDIFNRSNSRPFQASENPRKKDKKKKEHGRVRKWWKRRSKKFKVITILLVIILAGAGLLGARLYSFFNSVFSRSVGNASSAALNKEVKPDFLNTEGDGRLNVLLLGRGGAENEAPDLTDTILIASIDLKTQKASLMSIPRDLWVESRGSSMKVNAVYSSAKEYAVYKGKNQQQAEDEGIKTIIAKAREVSGMPIHKYVLTDYKAFRDIVNALGGIDVNVPENIYDGFTGWSFKKGPQVFDGARALQYARTRHGSARGDFDRTQNQRQLLVAMRDKATSTGIVANPVKLNSIANAVQKNIRTDLSVDEAKSVFNKTKDLTDTNIKSLDLAKPDKPLVATGNAGGLSIVRPTLGLVDYADIRAYARSNMQDPYLKAESPSISIYNGSGRAGLAMSVADIMSSYGYKVLIKETAKENQPKTLVVKTSEKKTPFTSRLLFKRFNTAIINKLPGNIMPPVKEGETAKATGDFVIVLGSDFSLDTDDPTW